MAKHTKKAPPIKIKNPKTFFNRELSWLSFNQRVLREASSERANPLLERLNFLSIFEANLIEFFMIRVAGLKQIKASSYSELQLDGHTPLKTLESIFELLTLDLQEMEGYFKEIHGSLKQQGIQILLNSKELTPEEKKFSKEYFHSEIFRVLTPLSVGPGHPFPRIRNTCLNLVVVFDHPADNQHIKPIKKSKKQKEVTNDSNSNNESYAIIEVPHVLPRFINLMQTPSNKKKEATPIRLIPLEEIIKLYLTDIFTNTRIKVVNTFTIIRNNELAIDEIASDNLLSTIEDELKNRRLGEVVCMHCDTNISKTTLQFLCQELDLEKYEIYHRTELLNLQDLRQLTRELNNTHKHLQHPPFIPCNVLTAPKGTLSTNLFSAIHKKTYLLHHPYDSFQSVVELIKSAAHDPDVLAIKQTLYRVGQDSPFVNALITAAENGKQVTALVELKARFDEERNINWAREMENHGVHVVYGLVGLKIHAKILQIVRREDGATRSYTHLSTGNYNPVTARLYTDLGLLTAEPQINHDVAHLFHVLTGASTQPRFKKIIIAPLNLRYTLLRLIQKEISNAKKGKPAHIQLKMNALVDPEMITALYKASSAGVKIDLNIRGTCCLRPGLSGISDNIRVHSIVGRFLEHSRIFYFANAAKPRIFLSSADWMPRNLNQRIEILFPIEAPEHIQYLQNILEANRKDSYNSSKLLPDGTYRHLRATKSNKGDKGDKNDATFDSQNFFCEEAGKKLNQHNKQRKNVQRAVFQPLSNPNKTISTLPS